MSLLPLRLAIGPSVVFASLAGCVADDREGSRVTVNGAEIPEGAVYTNGVLVPRGMALAEEEIARGDFALGPVDAPPTSATRGSMPFQVPEKAYFSRIVVAGESTASEGFTWEGPGSCSEPTEGNGVTIRPHVQGSFEDERACGGLVVGENEILVRHTTGSTRGTIVVYATFLRAA